MKRLDIGFAQELSAGAALWIETLAKRSRYDTVRMIDAAGSGHIGGSFSSMDLFAVLWACKSEQDTVVVSHGHTAPAAYSILGNLGYFDLEECVNGLRRGTRFEGHPSPKLPGVEWCSGSLGQGLSVGCGFALAKKIKKEPGTVFVVMGDGEQAKGQLQEAREFAVKFGLNNLAAVIDYNKVQSSGKLEGVLPQRLEDKYNCAGWNVIHADGHSIHALHKAVAEILREQFRPCVLIADTVMGKGVPEIENDYRYHGQILAKAQRDRALRELELNAEQERLLNAFYIELPKNKKIETETLNRGCEIIYQTDTAADCRSAFGAALASVAQANSGSAIAALDCDLAASVKLTDYQKIPGNRLIQCGIAEHNAATVGAALSKAGITTAFADFAVFGIDETYGQHRMSDINGAPFKLFCTHAGLDVGEDGKTHQCIDYISIIANLFGCKLIIPADANQTDKAVRHALVSPGAYALVMGRSKLPVIGNANGEPIFGEGYEFEYGKADWLRKGKDGCVVTYGTMAQYALEAAELLAQQSIEAGVLNVSCPLSLDGEKIREAAESGRLLVLEDHNARNGLGSLIAVFLAENAIQCGFLIKGITHYGGSDAPNRLYAAQGLNVASIVDSMRNLKNYKL